jgi:hypothetical protein
MNLTQLTEYVWAQTDTSEFDLPAATIASYIDEAFERTIAGENRWPFYEKTWDITLVAGDSIAAVADEVNLPTVMSLRSNNYGVGVKMTQLDQTEAEYQFGVLPVSGDTYPMYYSFWERYIYFWPLSVTDYNRDYVMRGYRRPLSTFAAGGEVDADDRLHKPLAHYAIALAYAQQEDEYLENVYMTRWQRDVEMARKAIMDPRKNRPIVMHGNLPRTPIGGHGGSGLWP